MTNMKDLKDYREKELKSYVIGNILIILLVTGIFREIFSIEENVLFEIFKSLFESAIISSVLYIYVFIVDSLIPGDKKFEICYLGYMKMPGFTIFIDAQDGKKKALDGRYTAEDVKTTYVDIYTSLEQATNMEQKKELQNTYWYHIYRLHETEPAIYTANRDFLLCRDICIMTVWLLLAYWGACAMSVLSFSCELTAFFVVEFVFAFFAVRGKGARLARNVLAADIHPRARGTAEV